MRTQQTQTDAEFALDALTDRVGGRNVSDAMHKFTLVWECLNDAASDTSIRNALDTVFDAYRDMERAAED